jgi:hypothetical protein
MKKSLLIFSFLLLLFCAFPDVSFAIVKDAIVTSRVSFPDLDVYKQGTPQEVEECLKKAKTEIEGEDIGSLALMEAARYNNMTTELFQER